MRSLLSIFVIAFLIRATSCVPETEGVRANNESFTQEMLEMLEKFWGNLSQESMREDSCGHRSYACVWPDQCKESKLITDGEGIINIRILPEGLTCSVPETTDDSGICCLIPGKEPTSVPLVTCPQYQECVESRQCGSDGFIIADGNGLFDPRIGSFDKCLTPDNTVGVCCKVPPIRIEKCPEDSECVFGDKCYGQALNDDEQFVTYVSSGLWSVCKIQEVDGVCCKQSYRDSCPNNSLCLKPEDCYGTALSTTGNFLDYGSTGNWDLCSTYSGGVCCINPTIEPTAANKCGIRNTKLDARIDTKIANIPQDTNREALFGEFPWQAIIFYKNHTYICGGSLISQKHLLTAAHCVHSKNPTDIRIRLGDWQVNTFDEKYAYADYNVSNIYIHPNFKSSNLHNDIAVIELENLAEYTYHINTVCLPTSSQSFKQGKQCIATGWGKDTFEGNYQQILKKVSLPLVKKRRCERMLRRTRLGRFFILDDSFICAGGMKNEDACTGDGGGPLVCEDESSSQYVLAGIIAWGIDCGKDDVPGVYVDVSKFTTWINSIIYPQN